jgi:DNA-binding LytR/AlgR family response regulator
MSSDNLNIIIVEDEPIIAEDLKRTLTKMGFTVIATLESGEEAISFVDQQTPDIILMDIQLDGDLDGVDTAHQISRKYPIPIIYLTSNTDDRTFNRAKLTQPFGFLSKPFRIKDVVNSINLAFNARENDELAQAQNLHSTATQQIKDHIFVKSKEHLVKIKISDLIYAEADGCYCTLATTNGVHLIVSTLKKFHESISHPSMMRIHRSFIINMNFIDKLGDNLVYLNEKQIPIGRSYKEELYSKIPKL